MLAVIFVNDGTGDVIEGHYKWKVMINKTVLAEGMLKNHNRLSGWQGLVKSFGEQVPRRGEKPRKTKHFTMKQMEI